MGRLSLLTIVIFTLVSVSQELETRCVNPPKPCKPTKPYCKPGLLCLRSPSGQKECRKCPCRHNSECIFDGKNVNCTNCKDGFTGDHCECPPTECDDIYGMKKVCTHFTPDGYLTLSHVKFTEKYNYYNAYRLSRSTKPFGECFTECIESGCQVFEHATHGDESCIVHSYEMLPVSYLMRNVVEEIGTYIYVRSCDKCIDEESEGK